MASLCEPTTIAFPARGGRDALMNNSRTDFLFKFSKCREETEKFACESLTVDGFSHYTEWSCHKINPGRVVKLYWKEFRSHEYKCADYESHAD